MHITTLQALTLGAWAGIGLVGFVIWWFEFRNPPEE